jgi:hypothetical protein
MNPLLSHFKTRHINPVDSRITITKLEQKQKYNLNTIPQEQLGNIIIDPKNNTKLSMDEFNKKYNEIEKQYSKETTDNIWQKRTNITYKKILKHLIENKDIKTVDDLIVYKSSVSDKDYKKLEKDFQVLLELRKKYTIELIEQFSDFKKEENLKKFKYSNLYTNNKYNPNDAEQLKTNFNSAAKIVLTKPEILGGRTIKGSSSRILLTK